MTELGLTQMQQVGGGWAPLCMKKYWIKVVLAPAAAADKPAALGAAASRS